MKNSLRLIIVMLLAAVCSGCCIVPVGHGHHGHREGGRGEDHGERRGGGHDRGEHHDRN